MYGGKVQRVPGCLRGARVTNDPSDFAARRDELLRGDGEVRDVLDDRPKDVLRDLLTAAIDATVRHSFGLAPLHVVGHCPENTRHVASSKGLVQASHRLDVLLLHQTLLRSRSTSAPNVPR